MGWACAFPLLHLSSRPYLSSLSTTTLFALHYTSCPWREKEQRKEGGGNKEKGKGEKEWGINECLIKGGKFTTKKRNPERKRLVFI